jgi:hypothetical protein
MYAILKYRSQPQNHGDQIGRFFPYWAIVNFGQFFKITEVA